MKVTPLAYGRNRKDGFSLIFFGTFVLVAGMAMTIAIKLSMPPSFFDWIPLLMAGGMGVLTLGTGVIGGYPLH